MYQTSPAKLSQDTLPTMYDLPSENVGDSGLPDTFHFFQAELLNNTFLLVNIAKMRFLVRST